MTSTVTVFLVAVMSITRSIFLLFPFKRLNKTAVTIMICGYIAVLVVQASIPLWIGQGYVYQPDFCTCMWGLPKELGTWKVIYENIYNFEYYFPIIPIIVSCFVTICSLKKSDCNEEINKSNKTATTTIVGLTMMYVIFNIPPSLMFLIAMIVNNYYSEHIAAVYSWDKYWYFYVFQLKLTVSLNSALNPALYFWRMKSFKRHVIKLVRGAKDQLRSISGTQITELVTMSSPRSKRRCSNL